MGTNWHSHSKQLTNHRVGAMAHNMHRLGRYRVGAMFCTHWVLVAMGHNWHSHSKHPSNHTVGAMVHNMGSYSLGSHSMVGSQPF